MMAVAILEAARPQTEATYLRHLLAANHPSRALQIAVEHVVATLGCDVSWVGLVDGDYLVMGAHAGLATAEMASAWRLRIGEGIGGRVASERRTHMSRDYRHDSRRVPLMKRLIDNEGIQATLTVPLLMGDEAFGVLYAAQRKPYPWTESEQQELEGIGQDLAVRLRQLDVGGRREASARMAEREAERALAAQQACASLAMSLGDQDDPGAALDLLALEIGARVELRHRSGRLIRSSGTVDGGNSRVVWRRELSGADGLTVSVVDGHDFDAVTEATINLATGLFRLQLLRQCERERTIERIRGELLDQLLTGRIDDPELLRQRLLTIGMYAERGQVIVVGSRRGDSDRLARVDVALSTAFERCTTVVRSGRIVGVIDTTDSGLDVRTRLESLAHGWGPDVVVGVGRSCQELGQFSMSYDQARVACELTLQGSDSSLVVTADDLGIAPLASVPLDHLRSLVSDALGPLLEADKQRGSDLVETLRVYLSHDRHLPTTAAALHVHYNTVRNRIARIEELLGLDIRDVEARLRLQMALRMHVLTTLPSGRR